MRKLPIGSLAGLAAIAVTACATTTAPSSGLRLRKVALYQNGIGYFERSGVTQGSSLRLDFLPRELDDVLKTLTVIDKGGSGIATVAVAADQRSKALGVDIRLGHGKRHDLLVAYAVPTPAWKASYRIVLDDDRSQTRSSALLQAWAMVNNESQEDWTDVELTLATGAPMSYALDLHTPEFVSRPDANGILVSPVPTGPVASERVGAAEADGDGDGLQTFDDLCPNDAEDRDGFEDGDGCPEPDNDRDRIADSNDQCPSDSETYNGAEDEDGCPDRGRVVVTNAEIEILQKIYFRTDADEIRPESLPLIDATAETLNGNPDITLIEIGGHASSNEKEPWGLSSRRAAAVRSALVERGVASERLQVAPYGATQPIDPGRTAQAFEANRRIEFIILARSERSGDLGNAPSPARVPTLDARTVAGGARAATAPHDVAGTVQYVITEPVTIPRGNATMVSILNQQVPGEDAYLFRPDGSAPGSEAHPFRAARIDNGSGFTLQPGPVAIFARGTFVGEGLLALLNLDETAWIPYALDTSTRVTSSSSDDEKPLRVVALHRGVLTVENAAVRTTRYTVAVGREAPARIFIRHLRMPGYDAVGLPPQTINAGDSYLIPLPISAGKTSVLEVEEREPQRRDVEILDASGGTLALYVAGGGIPPALTDSLGKVIALRKEMGAIEDDMSALRDRMSDANSRTYEIRVSIESIDRVRGAADLRKKLVARLAEAVAESDRLARELGTRGLDLATARLHVEDAVRDLELDEAAPVAP